MDSLVQCDQLIAMPSFNRFQVMTGMADEGEGSLAKDEVECTVIGATSDTFNMVRYLFDALILADFILHFVLGYAKYDLKRRKAVYIWDTNAIIKHYLSTPSFFYDAVGGAHRSPLLARSAILAAS